MLPRVALEYGHTWCGLHQGLGRLAVHPGETYVEARREAEGPVRRSQIDLGVDGHVRR
jgi:hypothetical protein